MSLAAVTFYLCLYFGVAFTYIKYAQDGAAFFRMLEREVSERIGVSGLARPPARTSCLNRSHEMLARTVLR